jgi:Mrp family chromosome partitioning ATPase
MSKILEAMRKAGSEQVDFAFQIATLDTVSLFPPPPASQMPEFEQLGNALISHQTGSTGQVVVFASTSSGEGTSYVSFNLARHLSYMVDRKVAWIDGNFRSPQAALPSDGVTFRTLLQNPALFPELKTGGNLVIVPHGDAPIKATDLLTSDNYVTLLEQFQRTFYFTIIDAPPILESVDVAHLAGPTTGLVLVVESRRLKHEVIRHGLANLATHEVTVLGTVLNKRVFDIPNFLYRKL